MNTMIFFFINIRHWKFPPYTSRQVTFVSANAPLYHRFCVKTIWFPFFWWPWQVSSCRATAWDFPMMTEISRLLESRQPEVVLQLKWKKRFQVFISHDRRTATVKFNWFDPYGVESERHALLFIIDVILYSILI